MKKFTFQHDTDVKKTSRFTKGMENLCGDLMWAVHIIRKCPNNLMDLEFEKIVGKYCLGKDETLIDSYPKRLSGGIKPK